MPAFQGTPGMPYWQDCLTKDVQKSAYFYSKVLGWEVTGETYRVARKDGLPVAGFVPSKQERDLWVTYFMDADGSIESRVEPLGGKVLSSQEVDFGVMTVCADSSGGLFGWMRPAGEDAFVAAGEPGVSVWYECVAPDEATVDFYGELFDWELRKESGYYIALQEGAAFLGLRLDPRLQQHGLAAVWHSYFGVKDVDAASHAVRMGGGQVLAGPTLSPFGPMLGAKDATGANVYLCEVPEPVGEDVSEADSILDL